MFIIFFLVRRRLTLKFFRKLRVGSFTSSASGSTTARGMSAINTTGTLFSSDAGEPDTHRDTGKKDKKNKGNKKEAAEVVSVPSASMSESATSVKSTSSKSSASMSAEEVNNTSEPSSSNSD